jgi:hypothetical protein
VRPARFRLAPVQPEHRLRTADRVRPLLRRHGEVCECEHSLTSEAVRRAIRPVAAGRASDHFPVDEVGMRRARCDGNQRRNRQGDGEDKGFHVRSPRRGLMGRCAAPVRSGRGGDQ